MPVDEVASVEKAMMRCETTGLWCSCDVGEKVILLSGMEGNNFNIKKGSITVSGTEQPWPAQFYQFHGMDCLFVIPEPSQIQFLPSQLPGLLDVVPNSSMISQLVLLDEPIAGLAHTPGEVDCIPDKNLLYLINAGENLATVRALIHGWAHVAFRELFVESRMFALGAQIESGELTEEGVVESWAELFTEILADTTGERVEEIGMAMPLSATALMYALRRALDTAFDGGGPHHPRFEERVGRLAVVAPERAGLVIRHYVSDRDYSDPALRYFFYLHSDDVSLLATLKEIDLSYEYLSDKDLARLKFATTIEKLILNGTAIGRDGLRVARGLVNLKELQV